jgi:hypothetical protein
MKRDRIGNDAVLFDEAKVFVSAQPIGRIGETSSAAIIAAAQHATRLRPSSSISPSDRSALSHL